ncbi:hypothetical protein ANN_11423 [Periplaneta americana]|uniref:Uncharacterized protein n=1 Tax=Periplaneta americana TaxID=6978 RepID=A0ABQ8T500_PERAM|nr:hypothetical protein ANN_11423 [Periplaneta americana]
MRSPPEAADSLDRPPWNVVQRCWMASAMAPEADLLGGGVSPRADRGALGEFSEAGMREKEVSRENPLRRLLCPPQIPSQPGRGSNSNLLHRRPERYHLSQRRSDKHQTSILISKISILNSKCDLDSAGNKVRHKLEQVLQRNVGLKDLRTASDILAGKNTDLQCNIPVQLVSKLKYAPVTSVDVDLLSKNLKVRIYKTVILPVLLYGYETWTLTLREEHRLRVFENKVLRKIFGAKRDEVTGEWRKLHNTELHALYSSPDIIRNIKSRRLKWAGHVARMGESRNAYRVLVGRPEGKRPLGRPGRRWEDNIKMDLREVGYDDRDWINLAQDRDRWQAYVRAAMNLRVP